MSVTSTPKGSDLELREQIARVINPVDWEAHDAMSADDFKYSGLDVRYSLTKAAKILSLISAARKGQGEWRPIESAPKDGTPILVYFQRKTGRLEGAYRVEWHNIHGETTPDEGLWCVDDEKHGPYPLRGWCDGDQTHWMPIPLPPPSKQEE